MVLREHQGGPVFSLSPIEGVEVGSSTNPSCLTPGDAVDVVIDQLRAPARADPSASDVRIFEVVEPCCRGRSLAAGSSSSASVVASLRAHLCAGPHRQGNPVRRSRTWPGEHGVRPAQCRRLTKRTSDHAYRRCGQSQLPLTGKCTGFDAGRQVANYRDPAAPAMPLSPSRSRS
jgi:hypothetical protein